MRLQIVPFGEIPTEVLSAISEELELSFRIFSDISEPKGLPKEYYNPYRHQYVAPQILDFLFEEFKGRVLAVTDQDLFAEDLNFVFGQAQMNGRVAVISICRLNPTFYRQAFNKKLLIERAVKEAVHEVGHMAFGLTHCPDPNCVMSFSNTIFDVDRKSKEVCKSCKRKAGLFD
ncbi:MAG: archaemetzincin family Zn-dependent metalloprotease [Candidatus Aenigmarchaeota archaeon]|nr:archaemetzincin family Zn-dependent metalloprotease [Candidatus Aenigmarchaeota archaeon]